MCFTRTVTVAKAKVTQLVISSSLVETTLELLHDAPSARHPVCDNTSSMVRAKYYWPTLRVDIEEHIALCLSCGETKGTTKTAPIFIIIIRGHTPRGRVASLTGRLQEGGPFEPAPMRPSFPSQAIFGMSDRLSPTMSYVGVPSVSTQGCPLQRKPCVPNQCLGGVQFWNARFMPDPSTL